jgi:DNA-binding transcriptional regulator YdaS (Cro superfamily)
METQRTPGGVLNVTEGLTPLQEALQETGITQASLARALTRSQAIVSQWAAGVKPISAEACRDIERATKGLITRIHLRPDIFGPL